MDWANDDNLKTTLDEMVTTGYQNQEILSVVRNQFGLYSWRRLQHFGIKRHDHSIPVPQFMKIIEVELQGPSKLLGIRGLHQLLRTKYKLKVKRDDVEAALNILDPEGLDSRKVTGKRKKFHKRAFESPGPNFSWSLDGHDKLSGLHKHQFPIGIHGCIDTYSRKILWLRVWPSNCLPILPARLYFETAKKLNMIPLPLRSDRGNENVDLFKIHNLLRDDETGKSFIYGSSVTNQAIERWWKDLRERHGDFFKNVLNQLAHFGLYNDGDETCRVILSVLLIPLLQESIDDFAKTWNSHRIRNQRIARPCSIPNLMYKHPEHFGHQNYGKVPEATTLKFVEQQMGFAAPMQFISVEVQEQLAEILVMYNLFPVTLHNFQAAYTAVHHGCLQHGVELKFEKTTLHS